MQAPEYTHIVTLTHKNGLHIHKKELPCRIKKALRKGLRLCVITKGGWGNRNGEVEHIVKHSQVRPK